MTRSQEIMLLILMWKHNRAGQHKMLVRRGHGNNYDRVENAIVGRIMDSPWTESTLRIEDALYQWHLSRNIIP